MSARAWQTLSAVGTLAILALVPGNVAKLLALISLWALTFRPRLTPRELCTFVVVSALFTALNARALENGIFAFSAPDLWGMPIWELLMWGFYLSWSRRVVGGPRPRTRLALILPFSVVFSLPFGLPLGHFTLTLVSLALLAAGLLFFHQKHDVAMVLVMVLLGAAVEYMGVLAGLWHYPGGVPGGVPPWFITLWGGVGLIGRRLLPFLDDALETLLTPQKHPEQEVGR